MKSKNILFIGAVILIFSCSPKIQGIEGQYLCMIEADQSKDFDIKKVDKDNYTITFIAQMAYSKEPATFPLIKISDTKYYYNWVLGSKINLEFKEKNTKLEILQPSGEIIKCNRK